MTEYCYILYDAKIEGGRGVQEAECLTAAYAEWVLGAYNIRDIADFYAFFKRIGDNAILICGNDAMLNQFVNASAGIDFKSEIYYFAFGTGNDFLRDITGRNEQRSVIRITEYLKNAPICCINGKAYKFLNGVGLGVDGCFCEIVNNMTAIKQRTVNYTSVLIKSVMLRCKPTGATILLDGNERKFEKVWLAAVLNGRYSCGGMETVTSQMRFDKNGELSLLIIHDADKFEVLRILLALKKGKRVKLGSHVEVLKGRGISVRIENSATIQIDGMTKKNIFAYYVQKQ